MKGVVKMKKIASLAVCIMLMVCCITTVAVAEAKVTIMPEAADIPKDMVQEIVESNPGYDITIYEWGNVESGQTADPNVIIIGSIGFDVVTKTTKKSNVVADDRFIISVAKGQTITLGTKKSFSLKNSVTGKATAANLGLEGTLTVEYTASSTWSGPPESSSYNSREYRVKLFENQGTYTGYQKLNGVRIGDLQSGEWTEPSRYAQYSRDSRQ